MLTTVAAWAKRRPARTMMVGVESRTGFRVAWIPKGATGGRLMLILTNAQKVTLTVEPLDQYGNPAKIDGVPTWTCSDLAVLTLTPAADGLSAVAVTTGALGVVQVAVQADADLGTGIRPLTATLDVTVEASEAVVLGIKAGAPEPR